MTSTEPSAATGASSGSADLISTDPERNAGDGDATRPEANVAESVAPRKVSIFGAGDAASARMDDDPPVRPRPVRVKAPSPAPTDVVFEPLDGDEASPDGELDAFAAAATNLVVELPDTGQVPVIVPDVPAPDAVPDLDDDVDVDVDADLELDMLDLSLIDDLSGDEEEFVVVATGGGRRPRGKLKARKVRRIVRYVSPWSVFKVSLLFYFCMWVVLTIASVILWQLAVQSGQITNLEKFLAKLLAESSYTINGRDLFRAGASAGVVLVFAGTGFTVLMSLLFNVICDITGGVRFTVLELESTRREIKTRNPAQVRARAESGEFLRPVNRRGKVIKDKRASRRSR